MAVYSILPDTNLKAEDIRDTLNSNGGSVSNDLLTFFATNAKINKWARFKPESYKKNFDLTDEERFTNHYGLSMTGYASLWGNSSKIKVTDGKIDISEDTTGFLYKLCKGTLGQFDYVLPKGGENSPYRLGDFRGYNPTAVNPLPQVTSGTYKYSSNGLIDVHMNIATPSINGLTMELLAYNANTPLQNLYYGMIIYTEGLTDVIFGTQTAEQKSKGRNVLTLTDSQYASITSKRGEYKAKAFMSDKPIALNDYTLASNPSIFLADDDTYSSVILVPNYEAEVSLAKKIKTISSTKYRLIVNVTNNSASAITVTSCKFLQSGSLAEDSANNVPLTIAAWQTGQVYYETDILSGSNFTATLVINGKTYTV